MFRWVVIGRSSSGAELPLLFLCIGSRILSFSSYFHYVWGPRSGRFSHFLIVLASSAFHLIVCLLSELIFPHFSFIWFPSVLAFPDFTSILFLPELVYKLLISPLFFLPTLASREFHSSVFLLIDPVFLDFWLSSFLTSLHPHLMCFFLYSLFFFLFCFYSFFFFIVFFFLYSLYFLYSFSFFILYYSL